MEKSEMDFVFALSRRLTLDNFGDMTSSVKHALAVDSKAVRTDSLRRKVNEAESYVKDDHLATAATDQFDAKEIQKPNRYV